MLFGLAYTFGLLLSVRNHMSVFVSHGEGFEIVFWIELDFAVWVAQVGSSFAQ